MLHAKFGANRSKEFEKVGFALVAILQMEI